MSATAWAAGDCQARGFLIGATAGRTTLNGEGLQHQDGHSHLQASTIPNCVSYDPTYAYELAVIVRDGIHRMYENGENIFYYLTLYNENYPMPAMPERAGIEEAIVQGAYCWRTSETAGEQVHLLASGSIMQQAIEAAGQLEAMGYAPVIWSVTSFIELTREAEACERENRLHPLQPRRMPYIEGLFAQATGPVVAATDYLKSLPRGIAPWMTRIRSSRCI